MKMTINRCLFIAAFLMTSILSFGQKTKANNTSNAKTTVMKTYVIERNVPGAGKLTPAQLKEISQKSCGVLNEMGSSIKWVQSYVTGDKLYCIYMAENEELV